MNLKIFYAEVNTKPHTVTANKTGADGHTITHPGWPHAGMCSSCHLLHNYPSVFSQRISQLSTVCTDCGKDSGCTLHWDLSTLLVSFVTFFFFFLSFSDKVVIVLHIYHHWIAAISNPNKETFTVSQHLDDFFWLQLKIFQTKEMNCMCAHGFWEGCLLSLTLVYFKAGWPWKDLCGPVKHTFPTVTEGIVCLVQPVQDLSTNVRHKVLCARFCTSGPLSSTLGR